MRTDEPQIQVPTLLIDPTALAKLQTYADVCPLEVNGWGYLQRLSATELLLASPDDVFITEQEVTAGSADTVRAPLALAYHQAVLDGRGDEFHLQWHSHANHPAYHSYKDMDTIERYASAGVEWMVSMVINKQGELVVRYDTFIPFRVGLPMEYRLHVADRQLIRACRRDVEEMVRQRVTVMVSDSDEADGEERPEEVLIGVFESPTAARAALVAP